MARKLRVWYPGATYHISARGVRRSAIFMNDLDYLQYFHILEKIREKYPFKIHSYCLMTNHLHLQIETIEHSISHIMRNLHAQYAMYLNKTYQISGHVFQGRYMSKLIEDRAYFLQVSRYIHRNPLEAEIVENLEDYPWSSYAAYIKKRNDSIVTTSRTLNLIPGNSVEIYKTFVEEGANSASVLERVGGQSGV